MIHQAKHYKILLWIITIIHSLHTETHVIHITCPWAKGTTFLISLGFIACLCSIVLDCWLGPLKMEAYIVSFHDVACASGLLKPIKGESSLLEGEFGIKLHQRQFDPLIKGAREICDNQVTC